MDDYKQPEKRSMPIDSNTNNLSQFNFNLEFLTNGRSTSVSPEPLDKKETEKTYKIPYQC